jgi:thymidylate synthase
VVTIRAERDVVLEVITEDGTLDIGRWRNSTAKTSDILEPPSLPKLKNTPARRMAIIGIYNLQNFTTMTQYANKN